MAFESLRLTFWSSFKGKNSLLRKHMLIDWCICLPAECRSLRKYQFHPKIGNDICDAEVKVASTVRNSIKICYQDLLFFLYISCSTKNWCRPQERRYRPSLGIQYIREITCTSTTFKIVKFPNSKISMSDTDSKIRYRV